VRRAAERPIATAHVDATTPPNVAAPTGRVGSMGRRPLAEPRLVALEAAVIPAARGALLVSDEPGASAALIRRLDGSGRVGPPLVLPGEHVVEVLASSDDRYTLVTSRRGALCLATYRDGASEPEARGCADVAPTVAALVGDRVALIEARQEPPPEPPKRSTKAKAAKPSPKKPAAAKESPSSRAKKAASKKTTSKKAASKPSKTARSAPPRPPPPKPKVEVFLRWATRAGVFDAEATSVGLRFTRPLEGMTVVAAGGRLAGVDLVWHEVAPVKKGRGRLGNARLVAGAIDVDGKLVEGSRVVVYEGPLDYAGIGDHRSPRLLTSDDGSVVVGLGKDRVCEAWRVTPALARLSPSPVVCSIDPARLLLAAPIAASELAALTAIQSESPARTRGQPRSDLGLVGWAGERALYQQGGTLRSAERATGQAREEPTLMSAPRARIAWGAFERGGDGVALAEGKLRRVGADGAIDVMDLGELARSGALGASDGPARVARIGSAWFAARGDVLRIAPAPAPVAALAGRAHPDVSALVGGSARGWFLELAGAAFSATPLDAAGLVDPLAARVAPTPVRPGFAAVERRGGGALVAGVAAKTPGRVVAFAVASDGRLGPAHLTSLRVADGALDVSLVPLPQGGAWLTQADRAEVVWLDDEGRELGRAAWPKSAASAACVDGEPARIEQPTPAPGRFARVAELAEPGTCMVGDGTWATDGTFRWFGSRVGGFGAQAEVGIVRVEGVHAPEPTLSSLSSEPSALSPEPAPPPKPACPGDMVSVAGAYCIDRFESTLLDVPSGAHLSPDYPTTPGLLQFALNEWATGRERVGDLNARAMPLPFAPVWTTKTPVAVSRLGVRPNGYLSGTVAQTACEAAGKRLCTRDEFVTACRGEADTPFPYGDDYRRGVCNVDRDEHPAASLHGNASLGHLDPRLGRVVAKDGPLLRPTGATPACRSAWGDDAVYDLVGNLDEWVDDPSGFAGGFYSRASRVGCEALVTTHPATYLDYSTGARCCEDAGGASP
jgi:hypothetical protein